MEWTEKMFIKLKGKEKKVVSQFEIDRVNCITIFFNDLKILSTYNIECEEENNKIKIRVKVKNNIAQGVYVRVEAMYLSGRRFSSQAYIDEKNDSGLIIIADDFKEMEERRKSVKVRCRLICSCEGYQIEEFDAKISNICVGGLFLETDKEIELGTRLKIKVIKLKSEFTINIIRRQEDLTGYGCKFEHLTESDKSILNSFIFDTQREERKAYLRLRGEI